MIILIMSPTLCQCRGRLCKKSQSYAIVHQILKFLSLIILIGKLSYFSFFFPCYSVPLLSPHPILGAPKNISEDLRALQLKSFKMQGHLISLSNAVNIYFIKTPCLPSQLWRGGQKTYLRNIESP